MSVEGKEEGKILYEELSYRIVDAAITVWKKKGYGFYEKIYRKCLMIELRKRGIPFDEERKFEVTYDEEVVGDYNADLIADSNVLLELKTTKAITDAHVAQALNYLAASGLRLAIILNFGESKLEFRRVIR